CCAIVSFLSNQSPSTEPYALSLHDALPISSAISSGVASRPKSWTSCFWTRISLLIVSIMCTGMRMVRAWSAMDRVMAWRIHQVRSEEHTSELQSRVDLVCRLLLEKKNSPEL